jgi:tryptophan 2,3-dioxygenase
VTQGRKGISYWDYIRVEDLLSLQTGVHGDESRLGNDEVLFITVHQIFELWFKLVIRELEAVRAVFRQNPVPDQALSTACRSLRRCVTIFEVAAEHWKVVESLTTRDYLAFRDQLVGASGFQSAQIRQLEILLGLEDDLRIGCAGEASYKEVLKRHDGGSTPALERVERQIAAGPSFRAALYDWLARTPIDGSSDEASVRAYTEAFLASHAEQAQRLVASSGSALPEMDRELLEKRYQRDVDNARAFLEGRDLTHLPEEEQRKRRHSRAALVFIESHRELPRLAWPREVVETTLVLEQAMVIWRWRHARMVERVIGRRVGTGGSGGVDYLDATAQRYRVFDDLWVVRTLLLKSELTPSLARSEDYRFRIED